MYADFYHKPVMLEEILKWLCINKKGIYVDGTVGGAVLLRDGVHEHRLRAERRRPDAVRAGLHKACMHLAEMPDVQWTQPVSRWQRQ